MSRRLLIGVFVVALLAAMATSSTAAGGNSSAALFFGGDFNTCNLVRWHDFHDAWLSAAPPGFVVKQAGGFSGCDAQVNVTNQASTSATGDGSMLWEGNGANSYRLPWLQNGADTWFRLQVLFPDGSNPAYPGRFTPAPVSGGWDNIEAWHTAPNAGYSTYVGVKPRSPAPCLTFRPVGGPAANQTFTYVYQTNRTGHKVPLKYNHWYDITVHLVFGSSSQTGLAEWWVDGVLQYSGHVPTITTLSDGSVPGVGHEVGLYRGPSRTDTDTIYIDGITAGSIRPRRPLLRSQPHRRRHVLRR